ncbi:cupin domain-containing protein [Candidatus Enterococcus clewellii]|uniref:Cupin type-2 domain-containing protein n=1 Tax=Candidatus Enterococcus clewellii TaxID=1834193 RepID=A0A242K209_9ENTE|nr:cupin domain-containing protein [Enterococcus sp. 9E7_DIV0242]OTP11697.1 hypothetical protein A5888_003796 [Enterococcus sp. 9E7_DIV0242]
MINFDKELVFQSVDENTERSIVTYSESVMAVRVRFKQTTDSVTLHHHPEEQITHIVRGRFQFFEGEHSFLVQAGDTLRFEKNQPHGCIVLEPNSEVLDIFTPARKDFL